MEARDPAPGTPVLRPVFVWALALIAVPMLLLFGVGMLGDVHGPWRVVIVPAYVVGAMVAPAILLRRTVRAGGSRSLGVAGALAMATFVLLLDLRVFALGGGSARGAVLTAVAAGGALAVALLSRPGSAVAQGGREVPVGDAWPPPPSVALRPDLPPPPHATVERLALPPGSAEARPPAAKRRGLLLLAAVSIILIAGGIASMVLLGEPDPMPTSIDGVPRLDTDRAGAEAQAAERTADAMGGRARMAEYGYGSTPSFIVAVFEEPTEVGFDQEFRAFSYSFMGTSGMTLDVRLVRDEIDGGVHYRCQSDAAASVSVCVMGGGRRFTGLAVLGSDLASAFELAKKVQMATADVTL